MKEAWKLIDGFGGRYEVSCLGRVRSIDMLDDKKRMRHGRILRNARVAKRYLTIRLNAHGRQYYKRVHHLVLEAFVGARPEKMQACHNDGNPMNNRLSNLRWDTARNNNRDKISHGTIASGERNGWAKLTNAQARQVRRAHEQGLTMLFLSRKYGLSENSISDIVNKRSYKDAGD